MIEVGVKVIDKSPCKRVRLPREAAMQIRPKEANSAGTGCSFDVLRVYNAIMVIEMQKREYNNWPADIRAAYDYNTI